MDSETQTPDDRAELERLHDSPPPLAQECNTFKWKVEVIDNDGNIESKLLTSRDVWKLQNQKVIVHFDEDSGQPVGDSAGLLGSWLGQLSSDVILLPINYKDWRNVARHIKDKAWDVIQAKFWFDDPTRRRYVMSALGSRCKDVKLHIWRDHKRNDPAATLQNQPDKVPEDQWYDLVHMRFTEKWKKMQDRNAKNQRKNTMPHVCGRKGFGRRRHEIKIKTGKTPSRAEFFIATRKKSDGSFVSEEAKTRADALTTLMTQNSARHIPINNPATLDDEFAQVFGPERPGRVRCVGRGPTPSKLPRSSPTITPTIENHGMVVQLQTQMKALTGQVNNMSTFIQKIISNSSGEEATALAATFAAIVANNPNSSNSEEMDDGGNGTHIV